MINGVRKLPNRPHAWSPDAWTAVTGPRGLRATSSTAATTALRHDVLRHLVGLDEHHLERQPVRAPAGPSLTSARHGSRTPPPTPGRPDRERNVRRLPGSRQHGRLDLLDVPALRPGTGSAQSSSLERPLVSAPTSCIASVLLTRSHPSRCVRASFGVSGHIDHWSYSKCLLDYRRSSSTAFQESVRKSDAWHTARPATLVVGSAIVGACTAYFAVRRGLNSPCPNSRSAPVCVSGPQPGLRPTSLPSPAAPASTLPPPASPLEGRSRTMPAHCAPDHRARSR